MNDFGQLVPTDVSDEHSGEALVAVGEPAIRPLQELLSNLDEAPVFGSRASTTARNLHFRRADYAYRYLMLILGRKPTFPRDLTERDKLIADLRKELENRKTWDRYLLSGPMLSVSDCECEYYD